MSNLHGWANDYASADQVTGPYTVRAFLWRPGKWMFEVLGRVQHRRAPYGLHGSPAVFATEDEALVAGREWAFIRSACEEADKLEVLAIDEERNVP